MYSRYQNPVEKHLEKINSLNNLEPSARTNEVFSDLVSDIIKGNINSDIELSKKQILREKCGDAEFNLEKYWSKKIVESNNPEQKIREFPYYQNYVQLADFEYSTLLGCCENPNKDAVFVGGGPLPLTAIMFAKQYNFNITIIDRNEEAVELSRKLLEALNISGEVIKSDAEDFSRYREYGTVHVASMVGETIDEEIEVFEAIKNQQDKHSHIIARTAHGNRDLLYRPVSDQVKSIFNVKAESRPSAEIVNSTIVMTNMASRPKS